VNREQRDEDAVKSHVQVCGLAMCRQWACFSILHKPSGLEKP